MNRNRFTISVLSVLISIGGYAKEHRNRVSPVEGKAYFSCFSYEGKDDFYTRNPLQEDEYYNPILSGFFPDPSICQKGKGYYLVNSTFSFFPGIPVFYSNDLINWKAVGHVLERPEQIDLKGLGVSRGIFAPAISYNPHNDLFYLTTTLVDGKGNFVVTAKDPAGDWSNPVWLPEVGGIDPSLFFDDDGKAYLVNNEDPEGGSLYDGHKATWIQEFDVENNRMIGKRKMIRNGGHDLSQKPIWIEGPHIYKLNGYYYLIPAEGGTSINHSQVAFRSKSIWGPYETNPNNPILTQRDLPDERENKVTNAGHADLVQDENGDWYAVFLACRPYKDNFFNIGRETFILPVNWENDWPVILKKGDPIPLKGYKKDISADRMRSTGWMQQGNFSYADHFEGKDLNLLHWSFLRVPEKKWYSLDTLNSGIWIDCKKTDIKEQGQPALIVCRQQHHDVTVETEMVFFPVCEGGFAGLVLFQNEAFQYDMGIRLEEGIPVVVVEKCYQEKDIVKKNTEAFHPLQDFDGYIKLKVKQQGETQSFWYALNDGEWRKLLENEDGEYLSTASAGGFIGTMIGLYASGKHE